MAAHYVAKEDAVVVKLLKREGAIPIVRGNLCQFVYVGHTDNRIFGRAVNPYDSMRTCGGSSGGDGALVASRCVPFAIGTDIGGSIRSPASCSGIIGFKPTP
jgi:Asp-tRNA(Asn)/Glu-tRNA(Gln) amidotransferase A subunit family amidase